MNVTAEDRGGVTPIHRRRCALMRVQRAEGIGQWSLRNADLSLRLPVRSRIRTVPEHKSMPNDICSIGNEDLPSLRFAASSTSRAPQVRRGFTLLEVLLALGIFLVAMTAIGQLIGLGSRASVEARLEADAVLRAETALHEVLAGVQPMQTTAATGFTDDPDWQWTVTVTEGPHVDLLLITVTAFRQAPGEAPQNSVSLTRMVRNPDLFLEAALAAEGE